MSVWVRDVPLTSEQRSRLLARGRTPRPPAPPRPDPPVSRTCGRCDRTLPGTEFARDRDDWQTWCRSCFRAYHRERATREADRIAADRRVRRAAAREYLRAVKAAGRCADCGLRDAGCLEFDHLDSKVDNVSRLVGDRNTVARIQSEIARCDLVCANCHRRRTAARRDPRARAQRPATARNRRLVRTWASLLGCEDCGERDPVVLEYDHVEEKRANVALLVRDGVRIARLFEEMLRCEVRCANCHRRRHHRERHATAA